MPLSAYLLMPSCQEKTADGRPGCLRIVKHLLTALIGWFSRPGDEDWLLTLTWQEGDPAIASQSNWGAQLELGKWHSGGESMGNEYGRWALDAEAGRCGFHSFLSHFLAGWTWMCYFTSLNILLNSSRPQAVHLGGSQWHASLFCLPVMA